MPEEPENLSWLDDDLLSKNGGPINAYDSLEGEEVNDLWQLSQKDEEK